MAVSVYVNTADGSAIAKCSLCPSWAPSFDSEVKAWEIAVRHDEVAHGADRDQLPTPARYVDLVFAVRVGLAEDDSFVDRVVWLTETFGSMISHSMENPHMRRHVGMTFNHQFSFARELPKDRLAVAFSDEEIATLTDNWSTE